MKQNKKTAASGDTRKKPNVKLYIIFALAVIFIFGLYRAVLYMAESGMIAPVWFTVLMWVYLILAGLLFVAFVIVNRGTSTVPLTPEDLPSDWDHIKKAEFLEDDKRRRRIAKYLLIPCIAFIGVFIFEIAELFYAPAIKDWFENF